MALVPGLTGVHGPPHRCISRGISAQAQAWMHWPMHQGLVQQPRHVLPRHCQEQLSVIRFPSGLFRFWHGVGKRSRDVVLLQFMSSSALRWVCGQLQFADSPRPARVRSLHLVKTPRRGPACTEDAPCYAQLMGSGHFFCTGLQHPETLSMCQVLTVLSRA